tara:strand:- start:16 stop:411 length:396 start_codon:yes stop_codon:yes gene_type:complete
MYLIVGTVGLLGLIFYAAILGGGLAPFIDFPAFVIVAGGAFFATLAMSRGKFNQETVSFFGNSALTLGWIGFLIGIVLMLGSIDLSTAEGINTFFGKASPVALLTVLYGFILKLVCSACAASMMQETEAPE